MLQINNMLGTIFLIAYENVLANQNLYIFAINGKKMT
jgi:hypothetical protein